MASERLKARHKIKLIEYLADPESPYVPRARYHEICGITHQRYIYRVFTTDELSQIEEEALQLRRTRYSPKLAQVDKALLEKAMAGDSSACKLVFQKMECWSERKSVELDVQLTIAGLAIQLANALPRDDDQDVIEGKYKQIDSGECAYELKNNGSG